MGRLPAPYLAKTALRLHNCNGLQGASQKVAVHPARPKGVSPNSARSPPALIAGLGSTACSHLCTAS